MSKRLRRREGNVYTLDAGNHQVPRKTRINVKPVEALTDGQSAFIASIRSNEVTFGIGCSGTGKSYVSAKIACEMLDNGNVEKIIVTRPAVEAEEELGFLPGEIDEKIAPYFSHLRDVFESHYGASHVENMLKNKVIDVRPMAYLRGASFNRAFIILDEAQNVTPKQMKLMLTRIGNKCKVVISGDINQKDIAGESGLEDAMYKFRNVTGVGVVHLGKDDIVRSGFVRTVLDIYEPEEDYEEPVAFNKPIGATKVYADVLNDEGLMRFLRGT